MAPILKCQTSFLIVALMLLLMITGRSNEVSDMQLHAMENRVWLATIRRLQQAKYSLRGFYHVSRWQKYWKEVVEEQLLILDGQRPDLPATSKTFPSLLKSSDLLYLNIAVTEDPAIETAALKSLIQALPLHYSDKIQLHFNLTFVRGTYDNSSETERAELDRRGERDMISEGEYSTVMALQQYCQDMNSRGQKSIVYYFHNKGILNVIRMDDCMGMQ